jgi:hypothetical protein
MIAKVGRDEFALSCDYCEDEHDEMFETFQDAVEHKKDERNNWSVIKDENGGWRDLCPECNTLEIIRKLKGVEDL